MGKSTQQFADWDKGCARIVRPVQATQRNGKATATHTVPPFTPAYTFHKGDEMDPPATESSSAPPDRLWWAAWKYDDWLWSRKKDGMPEFGQAVETLCKQRVSFSIGLGGDIYCESRDDAVALREYFSDAAEGSRGNLAVSLDTP